MAQSITGITVCYNTENLIERAYNSIRRFHKTLPMIIVNGSDLNNACTSYLHSIRSNKTKIMTLGYNIGHGRGMDFGIKRVKTKYAMLFDTDIEMLKSPVGKMLKMMEHDTFGIGWITKTGYDGNDCGKRTRHKKEGCISYLHPSFQIINVDNYKKYHRYVHHGAPCYLTMIDIHKRNLSDKILIDFPELRDYIKHYARGTRNYRRSMGMKQIERNWEYNEALKPEPEPMKSIAFITRVHPDRERMLNLCISSVKAQINNDYIHILSRDDKSTPGYGTFNANKSLAKIKPIDAEYVMVLDDDDMLIDDCFVDFFSKFIKDKRPEIIFFKGSVENRGVYPRPEIWGKAPVYTKIASFCFVVRLDVWKKNIHTFGNRRFGGDFCFIESCYKNTTKHLWVDRLIARTQKGPGRGLGENEHA